MPPHHLAPRYEKSPGLSTTTRSYSDYRAQRSTSNPAWQDASAPPVPTCHSFDFSSSLAFDKALATRPAGTVTIPTPIIKMKKVNTLPPTVIG